MISRLGPRDLELFAHGAIVQWPAHEGHCCFRARLIQSKANLRPARLRLQPQPQAATNSDNNRHALSIRAIFLTGGAAAQRVLRNSTLLLFGLGVLCSLPHPVNGCLTLLKREKNAIQTGGGCLTNESLHRERASLSSVIVFMGPLLLLHTSITLPTLIFANFGLPDALSAWIWPGLVAPRLPPLRATIGRCLIWCDPTPGRHLRGQEAEGGLYPVQLKICQAL